MRPVLEITDLGITFGKGNPAVSGVELTVGRGRRVALIGESGSGKSVTAMSVLRLHDERAMSYAPGSQIRFDGIDILTASPRELREIRGARVSMIFQDPTTTLNPVFRVGPQICDVLRTHDRSMTAGAARTRTVESLAAVGIHEPDTVFDRFPHQLSGGMRQRVMIAMATAAGPELLIADEPTSALDVTVQAAVLDTLDRLASERGMSVLMITHDMGVVARFCDDAYVMYRGELVENGSAAQILTEPAHDYTRRLVRSVPRLAR